MEVVILEFGETKIQSETIYDGKILKLNKDFVKLENNSKTYREIIHHPGACGVVAIDQNKDILMVCQFRYAINQQILEIPAGKLDVFGESPLLAAKRELLEETGFEAKSWLELGVIYPSPGYCDEKIYLYVATKIKKVSELNLDKDEFLTPQKYNLDYIVKKIKCGEITDSKTICAILKAKMLIDDKKIVV